MKYEPINPELFIINRDNFRKQLKPKSVAIFNSNDEFPRNGDQNFPFRQNSDLFYLSSIDQEKTILLIAPDCPNPKWREALFLVETNEHIAVWYGHKYTMEEAQKASGIKNIYWLESFESALAEVMATCENVYLNTNENIRFSSEVPYRDLRFAKELKCKYPVHNYERSAPILSQLRVVKSALEVALIQRACDITEQGFRRVLSFVKPGVMEYEVEAEITREFIRNRATCHSYNPIIASGKNACVLHYVENDKECKDGDLLLLDIGAEYANYAGDLSRTIPVNGKFTPRQKEVYNAIRRVMKKAISMLVVGNTIDKYHAEVCKLMEKELINLGMFTEEDVKNQDPSKPLYFKYYMHGTSHFMGMDVHDVGSKQETLQPGMVFSCEPGLYIMEEGIGIRIEDDILITESGPVDLMASIPIEADDIEALMAK
ncbi:MAG: aminopeptidase P N-terminal domain-containing protein [Lentimicrobiaceae bacterium]|nr:aminopeptidase P N-terminal domain-containing protein [Lentimicrobiaceae bacterium]